HLVRVAAATAERKREHRPERSSISRGAIDAGAIPEAGPGERGGAGERDWRGPRRRGISAGDPQRDRGTADRTLVRWVGGVCAGTRGEEHRDRCTTSVFTHQ